MKRFVFLVMALAFLLSFNVFAYTELTTGDQTQISADSDVKVSAQYGNKFYTGTQSGIDGSTLKEYTVDNGVPALTNSFPSFTSSVISLSCDDLDGDNNPDLVVGTNYSSVQILWGNTQGGFDSPETIYFGYGMIIDTCTFKHNGVYYIGAGHFAWSGTAQIFSVNGRTISPVSSTFVGYAAVVGGASNDTTAKVAAGDYYGWGGENKEYAFASGSWGTASAQGAMIDVEVAVVDGALTSIWAQYDDTVVMDGFSTTMYGVYDLFVFGDQLLMASYGGPNVSYSISTTGLTLSDFFTENPNYATDISDSITASDTMIIVTNHPNSPSGKGVVVYYQGGNPIIFVDKNGNEIDNSIISRPCPIVNITNYTEPTISYENGSPTLNLTITAEITDPIADISDSNIANITAENVTINDETFTGTMTPIHETATRLRPSPNKVQIRQDCSFDASEGDNLLVVTAKNALGYEGSDTIIINVTTTINENLDINEERPNFLFDFQLYSSQIIVYKGDSNTGSILSYNNGKYIGEIDGCNLELVVNNDNLILDQSKIDRIEIELNLGGKKDTYIIGETGLNTDLFRKVVRNVFEDTLELTIIGNNNQEQGNGKNSNNARFDWFDDDGHIETNVVQSNDNVFNTSTPNGDEIDVIIVDNNLLGFQNTEKMYILVNFIFSNRGFVLVELDKVSNNTYRTSGIESDDISQEMFYSQKATINSHENMNYENPYSLYNPIRVYINDSYLDNDNYYLYKGFIFGDTEENQPYFEFDLIKDGEQIQFDMPIVILDKDVDSTLVAELGSNIIKIDSELLIDNKNMLPILTATYLKPENESNINTQNAPNSKFATRPKAKCINFKRTRVVKNGKYNGEATIQTGIDLDIESIVYYETGTDTPDPNIIVTRFSIDPINKKVSWDVDVNNNAVLYSEKDVVITRLVEGVRKTIRIEKQLYVTNYRVVMLAIDGFNDYVRNRMVQLEAARNEEDKLEYGLSYLINKSYQGANDDENMFMVTAPTVTYSSWASIVTGCTPGNEKDAAGNVTQLGHGITGLYCLKRSTFGKPTEPENKCWDGAWDLAKVAAGSEGDAALREIRGNGNNPSVKTIWEEAALPNIDKTSAVVNCQYRQGADIGMNFPLTPNGLINYTGHSKRIAINRDNLSTKRAKLIIKNHNKLDVLYVYLPSPDTVMHGKGGGKENDDINTMDEDIKETLINLSNKINEIITQLVAIDPDTLQNTLFVTVGDHGMVNVVDNSKTTLKRSKFRKLFEYIPGAIKTMKDKQTIKDYLGYYQTIYNGKAPNYKSRSPWNESDYVVCGNGGMGHIYLSSRNGVVRNWSAAPNKDQVELFALTIDAARNNFRNGHLHMKDSIKTILIRNNGYDTDYEVAIHDPAFGISIRTINQLDDDDFPGEGNKSATNELVKSMNHENSGDIVLLPDNNKVVSTDGKGNKDDLPGPLGNILYKGGFIMWGKRRTLGWHGGVLNQEREAVFYVTLPNGESVSAQNLFNTYFGNNLNLRKKPSSHLIGRFVKEFLQEN